MTSELPMSKCPYCGSDALPVFMGWECPACHHVAGAITPINNCDWCHFSPRIFPCPRCSRQYSPLGVGDPSWEIVPAASVGSRRWDLAPLSDLDISVTDVAEAALRAAPPDLVRPILAARVPTLAEATRIILYAVHEDPLGNVWAHLSYQGTPPPDVLENNALMQVSIGSRSDPEGTEASVNVTDILVRRDDAVRTEAPEAGSARPGSKAEGRRIRLREVEPFNIPPVDNEEIQLIMRAVTGNESFAWTLPTTPLSMMVDRVTHPARQTSIVHGCLLSVGYDEAQRASSNYKTMEEFLGAYCLSRLEIEVSQQGVSRITLIPRR